MNCKNCGASIELNQKYCSTCGALLSSNEIVNVTENDNDKKDIQAEIEKLKENEKKDLKISIILMTAIVIFTFISIGINLRLILFDITFLVLMDLLGFIVIKSGYKYKYKVLLNSENVKNEKIDVINDVENNKQIFKFNNNKFISEVKRKKLINKILIFLIVVVTLLFIYLYIKKMDIINFLLMLFFPLTMWPFILADDIKISEFVNDNFLLNIVKTDKRLILIKAKPIAEYDMQTIIANDKRNAKAAINYTLSSSLLPSLLGSAASVKLISDTVNLYNNDEYDKKVIENIINIDNDDILKNILDSKNNEYKIEAFNNPTIIKNNKKYLIIKGKIKKDNGDEVFEKRKIYKILDNIDNLKF